MKIQGILRAPVHNRGVECYHIIYSGTPGESSDKAVMLDSMEVTDKKLVPGDVVEGQVSWKYNYGTLFKGCAGVIERGTLSKCQIAL